eukprot:132441_1
MNAAVSLFHIILLLTLVAIVTASDCGQSSWSLGIKTSTINHADTNDNIYAKIAYHDGDDEQMTEYKLLDNSNCVVFQGGWDYFDQFNDISSLSWDSIYLKNGGHDGLAITGIKYIWQDLTSQIYSKFNSSDADDCFEGDLDDFWVDGNGYCPGVAVKLCSIEYGQVFKDSSYNLNVGRCYTSTPTFSPSNSPTYIPTYIPTNIPTNIPTIEPTIMPSINPTNNPTSSPTTKPSQMPSQMPTEMITMITTVIPNEFNTTSGSNGINWEIIIIIVVLGVIYCGIIMIGLYVKFYHLKNKNSMDNGKHDNYVQLLDPNEPKIFGTAIKSSDVKANDSDEDVLNEMITP